MPQCMPCTRQIFDAEVLNQISSWHVSTTSLFICISMRLSAENNTHNNVVVVIVSASDSIYSIDASALQILLYCIIVSSSVVTSS